MFTKFRVRNFKTHLDTEIELKDLTLLIGSNNSGKTNLLKAISFFLEIFSRGKIDITDYKKNTHVNHGNKPMIFAFDWVYKNEIKVRYFLMISVKDDVLETREEIEIQENDNATELSNISNGVLKKWDMISEYSELEPYKYIKDRLFSEFLADDFPFQKSIFMYSSLNPNQLRTINNRSSLSIGVRSIEEQFLQLLESIIGLGSQNNVYNKFVFFMRRFEESFVGIVKDNVGNQDVLWQFDISNGKIANFTSQEVSDGILKAAAIALICCFEHLPLIIMIEEIENGINQSKLVEFLGWLKHISDNGKNTQFILTSHSPSVIREFSDNLDSVYTFHLKRKKGYVSEVTNLNEALKMINRLGGLKEETVEEVDGVLHVRKYALTELFYNGILGEL